MGMGLTSSTFPIIIMCIYICNGIKSRWDQNGMKRNETITKKNLLLYLHQYIVLIKTI